MPIRQVVPFIVNNIGSGEDLWKFLRLRKNIITSRFVIGSPKGVHKFSTRHLDVSDVQFVLREFGTEEDETEVSIAGDVSFGVLLSKEAVFALLNVVTVTPTETPCEG